jgi:hypothetical protein
VRWPMGQGFGLLGRQLQTPSDRPGGGKVHNRNETRRMPPLVWLTTAYDTTIHTCLCRCRVYIRFAQTDNYVGRCQSAWWMPPWMKMANLP